MGRLEKIVVLTVLFLVAVILGFSLNSDEVGETPLAHRKAPRRDLGASAETAKAPSPAAELTPAPAGVMSTGAPLDPGATSPPSPAPSTLASSAPASGAATNTTAAPAPQPAPAATPYLVTSEGLEPTASEELKLYRWKAGDTFKALAQKYYGSTLHVARLRAANEGRDEATLAAGDPVLVSVTPATAADRIARALPPNDVAAAETTWAGGLYTVKQGDMLGTISNAVYGTSKKWRKIYDANKDVLGEDPNSLKVGTKLRIPE